MADKSWRRTALRNLFMYLVDMSFALAGFEYGWGLHVRSWTALIGLMLVCRFVWGRLTYLWTRRDAVEDARLELHRMLEELRGDLTDDRDRQRPFYSGPPGTGSSQEERDCDEGKSRGLDLDAADDAGCHDG